MPLLGMRRMKQMAVQQALRGAETIPELAARICYRSCEPRATQELSGKFGIGCWLHADKLPISCRSWPIMMSILHCMVV